MTIPNVLRTRAVDFMVSANLFHKMIWLDDFSLSNSDFKDKYTFVPNCKRKGRNKVLENRKLKKLKALEERFFIQVVVP